MLVEIYNFLYRLSGRVNLFILLGIFLFVAAVIYFLIRLKRYFNPLKKSISLYTNGKYVKALVYADYYLEKHPGDKRGLLLRADIENELGMYPESERDYYFVIFRKTQGDGIDTFEIKKRMIKSIFMQDKIYETVMLAKELLNRESYCPEGLYYLSLVYIGQLYFKEAEKILKKLLNNRPNMIEANYAMAINYIQLRMFDDALFYINRAIEIGDNLVYRLVKSAVLYFMGGYQASLDELQRLPKQIGAYERKRHFLFYLKLGAMNNYFLRNYDRAALMFKMILDVVKNMDTGSSSRKGGESGGQSPGSKPSGEYKTGGMLNKNGKKSDVFRGITYGENGRIKRSPAGDFIKREVRNPVAEYERRMGKGSGLPSYIEEYYRLKEVAIEEGKTEYFSKKGFDDPFSLLDINGLTDKTWIHISYLFSLVKAKDYKGAVSFIDSLRKEHPEIVGLKRVKELIEEKIVYDSNNDISLEALRKKSEKLMDKKKKRYELWEYIEEWEKRVLKPFEVLDVAGFSTKKRLNPILLFKKDTKFALDF